MKLTFAASFALAMLPALVVSAQQEPARFAYYGNATAVSAHVASSAGYAAGSHSPLTDCQCDNRKGYDLWCQQVGFFDLGRRSSKSTCCGGAPAPSCCAPAPTCGLPEPTCGPPAPTCCAPEPTCAPPAPKCCAPEPSCAPPAPTCCAPEPNCCAPARRRGLLSNVKNPLSGLHGNLKSLFSCKKRCSTGRDCCGGCCGGEAGGVPTYFNPSAPRTMPNVPESNVNPFVDDPATSIPVPDTTYRAPVGSSLRPVVYRR